MFREIIGGLMGERKGTPRPLAKEGGLSDDKARLAESFKPTTKIGQGFDRGGWKPISVPEVASPTQEKAPFQPSAMAKKGPSNPFEAEPLATDEIGEWSGANNPALGSLETALPNRDDEAAAAK